MFSRKLGVVLIVIGILMLGTVGVNWIWKGNFTDAVADSGTVAEEGTKTFDTTSIKKVIVRNVVGSVTVNGDENAKEGTVHFTKRLSMSWGLGTDQDAVARVKLNVDAKGDNEVIEVIQPNNTFWQKSTSVALEITLPPGAEIDIENSVGPINVAGMNTPVRAKLDVGSITIDGFRESVDAHVATGAISIRGGQAVKDVVAESAIGHIDVEVPRDVQLRVHATTDTGGISSDIAELDKQVEKKVPGARLNGKIGDGSAGTIDLSTATGSIDILRK